jgi:hypothetical protein
LFNYIFNNNNFNFKIYYIYWAGGMVQVVECLCSKCEALSSNLSTTNKEKRKKMHYIYLFAGVCSNGVWTQGLELARQMLYHPSHVCIYIFYFKIT